MGKKKEHFHSTRPRLWFKQDLGTNFLPMASFSSPQVPDCCRKWPGPRLQAWEQNSWGHPWEEVSFRTVRIVLLAGLNMSTMSPYCTMKEVLKLIFIVLKTKLKITIWNFSWVNLQNSEHLCWTCTRTITFNAYICH